LRVTRTFILCLPVNSVEPEALRGDLWPTPEGEAQPFPDEQALLALLHQLVSPARESPAYGREVYRQQFKPGNEHSENRQPAAGCHGPSPHRLQGGPPLLRLAPGDGG
jgi:hypothetical protein